MRPETRGPWRKQARQDRDQRREMVRTRRTTEELRRIVAAGMAGIVVIQDGQLCSGGREPIALGEYAAQDAGGWVYCLAHIPEPASV